MGVRSPLSGPGGRPFPWLTRGDLEEEEEARAGWGGGLWTAWPSAESEAPTETTSVMMGEVLGRAVEEVVVEFRLMLPDATLLMVWIPVELRMVRVTGI